MSPSRRGSFISGRFLARTARLKKKSIHGASGRFMTDGVSWMDFYFGRGPVFKGY
jgi:hypothetical protein